MSLMVNQGEFVIVIGSNGVGKFIFFNVFFGEVMVDSGEIIVDNIDVIKLLIYKCVGQVVWVFQDFLVGICEVFFIEENLVFVIKCGQCCGLILVVKKQYFEQFWDSLFFLNFGLEDWLGDKMGLLFGGQCQVVSLLMVSFMLLSILLLDEYIVVFDFKIVVFVLELII